MSFPIISADERLAEQRGIKGCIFGKSGIGKTSLLWTLDPATTLFMDLEAGDLAIEGWQGDTIRPRTWAECRDFAVFIGGPNPALRDDQPYGPAHFAAVCEQFGDPATLDKYQTIFIDSITVAGRLCFGWCKGQPEAFSEKTGKPDVRGAYGLHGREMIGWLEVIAMAELPGDDGQPYRAFVCQTINPWGFPAKDRSGRLAQVEEPHLGRLMEKIRTPGTPASDRLTYTQSPEPAAVADQNTSPN